MAGLVISDSTTLTAPALLGMTSRGAAVLTASLVAAMWLSATADLRGVHHPLLLMAALGVAASGVVGIVRVRSDPISARPAAVIAATAPVACGLTCLAIPGPLGHPNQFNALGAGVAVCAFMCMRGRTATAWCAFAAMVVVTGSWSLLTGQGLYGLVLAAPNVAVIAMATLFAVIVRPAATAIREQNRESIQEARDLAAANARAVERADRRAELRHIAWPTLRSIAAGQRFSEAEVGQIRLTEAQLRDTVRARTMNRPHLVAAVRAARLRGVEVLLFDDGASTEADDDGHRLFCRLAVDWLDRIESGSVTLRRHPPGRATVSSMVVVGDGGGSSRLDVDANGVAHGP